MRERLIKLITASVNGCARHWAEIIADYLIENGVIVPPCAVGNTVYYVSFGKIYEGVCHCISIHNNVQIHLYDCDGDNVSVPCENVFLTNEEAEAALKKMEELT